MKIVHIAPNAPYNDNWGYQDNILPKYHKKAGHSVTMIASTRTHKNGKIEEFEPADYVLDDGVRVIRLKKKGYPHRAITGLCTKLDVYPYLEDIRPDFVFCHGLGGTTIFDVVRYKRRINRDCVIVRDNHLDYNNCPKMQGIKGLLIRAFERLVVKATMPFVNRVYGVTPWRKQFAEEYYKVSPEKTDVLIMGADDEQMDVAHRHSIRAEVRQKYNVADEDFLVVTGGKIDAAKNIHLLMEACAEIDGIKLLIFGNIMDDVKDKIEELLSSSDKNIYVGWIDSAQVYRYFFAADLCCFPGGHSVMWEQACASKVPCVFKAWDGMGHLNNGGNSSFLHSVTKEAITASIKSLRFTEEYYNMKKVAESEATDIYLYSKIAEKSLECAKK